VWWSIISVAAFSYAGERMPWLTYHMAWPMILITGWALGRIIESTDWANLAKKNIPLTVATLAVFIASTARAMLLWNGPIRPFMGQGLEQLQATNAFLLPMIVSILSAITAVYLLREWTFKEMQRVFVVVFFAFLAS
jgi:hypothetical protein